jgi:PqqD family protein of HPr-rel-A system
MLRPNCEGSSAGAAGRPIDTVTASSSDHAATWRLPTGVSLLWQSWDEDEVIVFNRASGQTHLLDAFSAAVLRRIESAPTPKIDLIRHFVAELGLDGGSLSDRLNAVCQRFEELGLAEPDVS